MPSFSSLYLAVIVPASTFIPITMGVYNYRSLSYRLRALLFYLCVAVVINCIAIIYSHSNNLPLLHFYTMVEFMLLIRYYYLLFDGGKMRKYLVIVGILFPLFCIINFVFIQSIFSYNTYTRSIEAIILICCSLFYMITFSGEDDREKWAAVPDNWTNAGILIYFSGALSQFAFSNVVDAIASHSVIMFIWVLHATLVLIMYMMFTVSFSKCRQ